MRDLKIILFIFFLSFLFYNSNAQVTWQWALGTGSNGQADDIVTGICYDNHVNIYAVGNFYSRYIILGTDTLIKSDANQLHPNFFIAKFDVYGNVIWAKSYGIAIGAWSMCRDPLGNIYITGIFLDTAKLGPDTLINADVNDIFLAKCDSSGNMLWAKSSKGSAKAFPSSITADISGNIYLSGYYFASIAFDSITLDNSTPYFWDSFLIKYSPSGNPLWAKEANGNGNNFIMGIASSKQGEVYMTGYFDGLYTKIGSIEIYNSGRPLYLNSDFYIAKLDTSGNTLWLNSAGGIENEVGESISLDKDGNAYIGGYIEDCTPVTLGNIILPPNQLCNGLFFAKFNSAGKPVWAKSFEGYGPGSNSIYIDSLENIYMAGSFGSGLGIKLGYIQFDSIILINHSKDEDFFVGKFNQEGNVIWALTADDTDYDEATAVVADNHENAYIAGRFYSSILFGSKMLNGNNKFSEGFIAKCGGIATGVDNFLNHDAISIFPNPFKDAITIQSEKLQKTKSIILTDLSGKIMQILRVSESGNVIDLNLSKLDPSMYLLVLMNEQNQIISIQKIVKE